jgi:hypothetical protein
VHIAQHHSGDRFDIILNDAICRFVCNFLCCFVHILLFEFYVVIRPWLNCIALELPLRLCSYARMQRQQRRYIGGL